MCSGANQVCLRSSRFQGSGPDNTSRGSNDLAASFNPRRIAWLEGQRWALAFISDFLSGMKRDGSLQRIIDNAGLGGLEVVTSK
jgi:hypothetical protein